MRKIIIKLCFLILYFAYSSIAWGALSSTLYSDGAKLPDGTTIALTDTSYGLVAINALQGSLTWTVHHLTAGTDAGKWQYTYLYTPTTANKPRGIGDIILQFGVQPTDITASSGWTYTYNGSSGSVMGTATTDATLQTIDRTLAGSGTYTYDSWLDSANPSTSKVDVTTTFQGLQWTINTNNPNGSNYVTLQLTTVLAPVWGNIYMDGFNNTTNNGYGMVRNTDYDSPTQAFSLTGQLVTGKLPVPGVADTTPPTVTISAPSELITKNGPVSYTVTYADDNFNSSTLSLGDITLNATGTATGALAVSGTGNTRTVAINNTAGDGSLGISIASGTARDASGNLAPASGASATFDVDNTPPSVSIGFPSTAATNTGPVTYTVTYNDAHFDASTLSAGDITLNKTGTANGTVSVSSLGSARTVTINNITGDGTLSISIASGTAIDFAGNLAPAAGPSSTFNVDNTAPDTTITSNPSNPTNAASASFSFTSTKSGSTFQCSLDNASYAACTSPATYTGLAQGNHTFSVKATDSVGNTDPSPATYGWLIDTTAPTTTATPSGGTYGTTQSVVLTCSDSGGSNCDKIYYTTDGSTPTTSSSAYGTAISVSSTTTLKYFATDLAGNSEAMKSQTYTIDTTAPGASITATPANPTNAPSASFSFTAGKTGCTFQCSLDGAAYASCTSPATYTGLAQGNHTFSVKATDSVGNTDPTPATFGWLIDTTAPTTTATPSGGTYGTTQNVVLTCSDSGGSGCNKIYYTTDGSTPTTSSSAYGTTISVSATTTLKYFATDLAGNSEAVKSQTYTIDTTAPDTSITSNPSNPTNATSASFSFTSTKSGSTFQCSLDGAAYAACTSPASYTDLAQGNHTFSVKAADSVGNTDPTPASFSWLIDTTAPTTTATPSDGTYGTTQSVVLTCSDSGGSGCNKIYYTTDGSTPTTSSSAYGTAISVSSSTTLKYFATDLAGNSEAVKSQTYTIDTTAPDTSITSNPSNPTNATSASFSFTSTKSGSTFQCSLDGAAYAACTSPASYTGLAQGNHTFSVKATDSVGNTDPTPASFSWLIDTTAPTTTATPSGGTYGTTQSVVLTCSDSGGSGCNKIYYTTDGSTPTTSSSVYSTAISVSSSTTLKYFATDLAGNSETVKSQTYTGIVYGDADGDGVISVNDARIALQIASGIITPSPQQMAVCDVAPLVTGKPHPDGKIDIGDVVVILRKVVGLADW